jgi:esterase/lipase superfamily enzyme
MRLTTLGAPFNEGTPTSVSSVELDCLGARERRAVLILAGVVAILVTGCQTPVRLMPTPVAFSASDIDPFSGAQTKVARTDVPVLYATNRAALVDWPEPIFTALPGAELRVGIAHVRIGDDPLDWETLHRLSTSDDVEQRPIVRFDWLESKGTLPLTGSSRAQEPAHTFFRLVDHALGLSPGREIVVYVHGANSPVPRAVAQAAQFQHFATRRVVVVSFMWPSAGSILRYLTDVGNAAASVEPFAQLLQALAANTSASSISVLSYSAGAKIVGPALAKLAASGGGSPAAVREKLRLRNVYYAAPDADTRLFVDQMREYIDVVGRVTVAVNRRDSALRVSQLVHRASRAGRPDADELDPGQRSFLIDASRRLVIDLVEVDPDAIPGLARRSHAFWYEHPWVSSDVIALLLFDAAPARRGLEERIGDQGARSWTFPSDFDQRIARFFMQSAVGDERAGGAATVQSGAQRPAAQQAKE